MANDLKDKSQGGVAVPPGRKVIVEDHVRKKSLSTERTSRGLDRRKTEDDKKGGKDKQ